MTLNERIVSLCAKNGISQSELERQVGISKGSISKWKSNSPKGESVQKIADYFNVSPEYILTGKVKNVPNSDNVLEHIELIRLYDKLTPEQQKAIIQTMRTMAN